MRGDHNRVYALGTDTTARVAGNSNMVNAIFGTGNKVRVFGNYNNVTVMGGRADVPSGSVIAELSAGSVRGSAHTA